RLKIPSRDSWARANRFLGFASVSLFRAEARRVRKFDPPCKTAHSPFSAQFANPTRLLTTNLRAVLHLARVATDRVHRLDPESRRALGHPASAQPCHAARQ